MRPCYSGYVDRRLTDMSDFLQAKQVFSQMGVTTQSKYKRSVSVLRGQHCCGCVPHWRDENSTSHSIKWFGSEWTFLICFLRGGSLFRPLANKNPVCTPQGVSLRAGRRHGFVVRQFFSGSFTRPRNLPPRPPLPQYPENKALTRPS